MTKAKEEPKSAFKEEFSPVSTPAVTPKLDAAPEPEAKSLEIEQPESEDEEPTPAPAAAPAASAAVSAAPSRSSTKEIPAPSSNGQVSAVSQLWTLAFK